MEQNLIDIYDLIEHAIDNAFRGQMNLKFYDYLKETKTKKYLVNAESEQEAEEKYILEGLSSPLYDKEIDREILYVGLASEDKEG